MRRNLIFGIFGAIYGTGLFILAFGAAGFGEGTPSIFLLVSSPDPAIPDPPSVDGHL